MFTTRIVSWRRSYLGLHANLLEILVAHVKNGFPLWFIGFAIGSCRHEYITLKKPFAPMLWSLHVPRYSTTALLFSYWLLTADPASATLAARLPLWLWILGQNISNKSMFLSWAVIHVAFIIKCSWHITYWITKTIVLWIDKHYRIYETAQTWYENQYHTPSITSISTCFVPMWSMWPYQPIFFNNRKIKHVILNIMWHFFTCFLAREKNVLVSETQYIKNVLNRLPLSSPLVTVV